MPPPTARPSLCSTCGARKIGRCNRCRQPRTNRKSAHQRGYDRRWRTASLTFLARPENRTCAICKNRLAECVDHIIDHHGDKETFWDVSNWQPACIACNTRKAHRRKRH